MSVCNVYYDSLAQCFKLLLSLLLLYYLILIYLHPKCCLPTNQLPQSFSFVPSPLGLCDVAPPGDPPSLWDQVPIGLGTSSLTEARQGSSLLHMYCGPQTSKCTLFA